MVQHNGNPPKSTRKRKKNKPRVYDMLTDKDHCVRGEHALWRAVILQALMDATSASAKIEARQAREEAVHWLMYTGADFRTVCDNAGLDPQCVRRIVKRALLTRRAWRTPPKKPAPRLHITRASKSKQPEDSPGGDILLFARPLHAR